MGREPADIVIRNGKWVCVQSGEIIPKTDISIKGNRVAYVGPDGGHTIASSTAVIEAEGRFLVPGLLDGHMHVESGMVTITEFVRAIIPHGTTGIFIDPHEIANIFGLKGVKLMVDEARLQPIHVWVQIPSCVPSAPGFETPGASIGPKEIAQAIHWQGVIGLGEMMNFPGVYNNDEKMISEMGVTAEANKVIGGHYASPDLGLPFHGYVAGGPEDDHEGTSMEDAIARVRQGLKPMLRIGSAWHDVAEQIRAVTEQGINPRRFILCTDDSHAETLVEDGHMDRVVRQAISEGVDPVTAIQMATINTAEHFGVSRDVGMIAPGRFADILIVSNLKNVNIEQVISKGKLISQSGEILIDLPSFTYPDWVRNSIHIDRLLSSDDFSFHAPEKTQVMLNVIGIIENQAPTKHLRIEVPVRNQQVAPIIEKDISKIAIIERHKGTGRIQIGFVKGFGFNVKCSVASTVAHDCHHMIVVGTDEDDMAIAANELLRIGGGQIVVKEGEVVGQVELPIAGIMSSDRAEIVAEKAATVLQGFVTCGCTINNPNMQLSLLALVVIPELRISDLGLVDVTKFEMIPVIVE
jgi:adenine deaminase